MNLIKNQIKGSNVVSVECMVCWAYRQARNRYDVITSSLARQITSLNSQINPLADYVVGMKKKKKRPRWSHHRLAFLFVWRQKVEKIYWSRWRQINVQLLCILSDAKKQDIGVRYGLSAAALNSANENLILVQHKPWFSHTVFYF